MKKDNFAHFTDSPLLSWNVLAKVTFKELCKWIEVLQKNEMVYTWLKQEAIKNTNGVSQIQNSLLEAKSPNGNGFKTATILHLFNNQRPATTTNSVSTHVFLSSGFHRLVAYLWPNAWKQGSGLRVPAQCMCVNAQCSL